MKITIKDKQLIKASIEILNRELKLNNERDMRIIGRFKTLLIGINNNKN